MREPKETGVLSRRGFGAIVAAAGVSELAAQQAPAQPPAAQPPAPARRPGPPPEIPPFDAPIEFTARTCPSRSSRFP